MRRGAAFVSLIVFACVLCGFQTQTINVRRRPASGGTLYSITHVSDTNSGGENSGTVASITAAAYSVTSTNLLVMFMRTGNQSVTFTPCDNTTGNCPGSSLNTWSCTTAFSNSTIGTNQICYSFTTTSQASDVIYVGMSPSSQYSSFTVRQYSKAGGSWHLDANPTGNYAATGATMTTNSFSTAKATELIQAGCTSYGGTSPSGAQTIGGTDVSGTVYENAASIDQYTWYLLPTTLQSSITGSFGLNTASDPWTCQVASFYAQ